MTQTAYYRTSPYYNTPQSNRFLGQWIPTGIQPSATDALIAISQKHSQRPDLLSYDLYGTPRLWWIFAIINPDIIKDPISDLVTGLQIRVPTTQSIQAYL
jgi:hypothetical protein